MNTNTKKAIFLDKDGTLLRDIPYNTDVKKISLTTGACHALQAFAAEDYDLFIISNQSGIAKGYIKEEDLQQVEEKIRNIFQRLGIKLSGFYYCPHHPQGEIEKYALNCDCRKPLPGMLLKAAQDHDINLEQSWMIGDILDDVEAGNRAGCHTIMVNNGNETEWVRGEYRIPEYMVNNLPEAADKVKNAVKFPIA